MDGSKFDLVVSIATIVWCLITIASSICNWAVPVGLYLNVYIAILTFLMAAAMLAMNVPKVKDTKIKEFLGFLTQSYRGMAVYFFVLGMFCFRNLNVTPLWTFGFATGLLNIFFAIFLIVIHFLCVKGKIQSDKYSNSSSNDAPSSPYAQQTPSEPTTASTGYNYDQPSSYNAYPAAAVTYPEPANTESQDDAQV